MVIVIISILTVVTQGLLSQNKPYESSSVLNHWIHVFRLAQKISFLRQDANSRIRVQLLSDDKKWLFKIYQGSEQIESSEVEKHGLRVSISNTNFKSPCYLLNNTHYPRNFYFNENGDHTDKAGNVLRINTRFCFSDKKNDSLCLSSSGFIYKGICIP